MFAVTRKTPRDAWLELIYNLLAHRGNVVQTHALVDGFPVPAGTAPFPQIQVSPKPSNGQRPCASTACAAKGCRTMRLALVTIPS